MDDRNAAPKQDDAKAVWQKPEVASITPLKDAKGSGGAGFDFASEVEIS